MVELLLNCKADIKTNNKKSQALLHDATKYNSKAMVELLLKHKADNEAKDLDEKPPLQFAHAIPSYFPREENEVVQHFLMEYHKTTTTI